MSVSTSYNVTCVAPNANQKPASSCLKMPNYRALFFAVDGRQVGSITGEFSTDADAIQACHWFEFAYSQDVSAFDLERDGDRVYAEGVRRI